MRSYTAHLKAARTPILLREGWTWLGFLFGPVWLLARRAWIPAVLEIVALVLLFAVGPMALWFPALLGLALLVGLTGRDLVRWSLHRRGYHLAHVVLARDADAALLRLLDARADLREAVR